MVTDGSPATLVMLHPVGQDGDCWQFLPLQAPFYAHVFPNHGARERRFATLGEMADEVASATSGPIDIVGVAMGAMVGLHLMLRHPRRVRSAVLACGHADVRHDALLRRADETARRGMRDMLEETLSRWFTSEALRRRIPGVLYAQERLLAMDSEAAADIWRAMADHNVADALHRIEVPVTLIAGRQDQAVPVADVEAMHARLPHSRLQIVDAPHMIHLERPALLTTALEEHMRWLQGD